jgi:hypothetical protein
MNGVSAMLQRLRKGNGRNTAAEAELVPMGDVPQNPAIVEIGQGSGPTERVTITRLKGLFARASCSCEIFAQESWCQHCVDVLSLNPQILSGLDAPLADALRQLVAGLPLTAEARLLAAQQKAFATSLEKFDTERPDDIVAGKLATFTELVSDLAVASSELEDAVGRFRRRMDAWKTFPASVRRNATKL